MKVFIDIETCATSREDVRSLVAGEVRPPSNYKKQESIDAWFQTEGAKAREEAINKTALNGLWGEVIAIGLAIDDGKITVHYRRPDEPEAELLRHFAGMIELRPSVHVSPTWIGHNIESFDLRFLWQRCVINGVRPPNMPLERHSRHRYDTMLEWGGYGNRVSQKDLELAFNLHRSDPLLFGGADVAQALAEGRVTDVIAHCAEDVRLVREIYRRMTA